MNISKNNRIIGTLIGVLCMPALLWAQEKPFTVKAHFGAGIKNKALFVSYTLSKGQHRDTLMSDDDGVVVFKGTVDDERQLAQVIVLEGDTQGAALFYLEPGTIDIQFPHAGQRGFPAVSGTPLNEDYQHYREMLTAMLDSVRTANNQPDINEFSPSVSDDELTLIKKFIAEKPGSPISVDLLNQLGIKYKDQGKMLSAYEQLNEETKKSPQGKELLNRIKGLGAAVVGKPAPDFTLPDTEGKEVSLADFKGKYVLIDFWATWCAPCIEEMPNVKAAYDRYQDKNFEVLGVSLDRPDSKSRWLNKIQELGMTWPQVSDLKWWNSTAALLYNISSVPANFLVDPQGKIIAINLRGEQLQQKLAELLAAK